MNNSSFGLFLFLPCTLFYVVNEHNPYYAYAELKRDLPHLDLLTRKLAKLYFRMVNLSEMSAKFTFRHYLSFSKFSNF